MFLKLTGAINNMAIYVNMNLIRDFYERDDTKYGKHTALTIGTEDEYYFVKETPEEIMAMLNK